MGRRNGFGHPHPETLARLRQAGAQLFRTDEGGVVVVRARPDGSYRVSRGISMIPNSVASFPHGGI